MLPWIQLDLIKNAKHFRYHDTKHPMISTTTFDQKTPGEHKRINHFFCAIYDLWPIWSITNKWPNHRFLLTRLPKHAETFEDFKNCPLPTIWNVSEWKNELRLDVLCGPDDCLDDDNISLYDVHDVHVDDFHVHHDVHVDDIGLQDDPPCGHPRWCSTQTWYRWEYHRTSSLSTITSTIITISINHQPSWLYRQPRDQDHDHQLQHLILLLPTSWGKVVNIIILQSTSKVISFFWMLKERPLHRIYWQSKTWRG